MQQPDVHVAREPVGSSARDDVPVTPLLNFLQHPHLAERPAARLTVWRWVGWLCLLLLVAVICRLLLDGVLVRMLGLHLQRYAFLIIEPKHPSMIAVLVVVLGPAVEELAFRAFLSTSPKAIFIGLAFFSAYLCGVLLARLVHLTGASAVDHFWMVFVVSAFAAIVAWRLFTRSRGSMLALFRNHAVGVFWVSCIVFGAAHALGYTQVWWGLVLSVPQFFVGVGLAYFRIKFGLRWSIAAHCAYDWLVESLAWGTLVLSLRGSAKTILSLTEFALILFVLVYGSVVLARVARRRW